MFYLDQKMVNTHDQVDTGLCRENKMLAQSISAALERFIFMPFVARLTFINLSILQYIL